MSGAPTTDPALIGDIGATNARFGLVGPDGWYGTEILKCADHASLEDTIEVFLRGNGAKPRRAAIAVAGPVTGDVVKLTNHPWTTSIQAAQRRLALDRLLIVNDFVAAALAVPKLGPDDRRQVGGGEAVPEQAIGVIGPGTGLGVASLAWGGEHWDVVAGEGGHATAAAEDDQESAVLATLRRRFGHVSIERVVSGMGLVHLHEALTELAGEPIIKREPAEISRAALDGSDARSAAAVALFTAFLGGAAGNLALTVGARGGVYIAGGVVNKLGAAFSGDDFRERFEGKGRLQGFLAPIPTFVITHELPAFLGLTALLTETRRWT